MTHAHTLNPALAHKQRMRMRYLYAFFYFIFMCLLFSGMAAVIEAMQEGAGEMDEVSGLDASLTSLLYFSYLLYFSVVVSAVR